MLKSISKVADKSHISQPALSNQLSKLESEIGVKLFERSNKGVHLTEYGEVVLHFSKEILNCHRNLVNEIDKKKNESKEVKIAVTSIESNILVSKFCVEMINIFEGFNVIIDSNHKENEQSYLINNSFDAIIGKKLIEDKDVHSKHLKRDKFIIVSKKKIESNKISEKNIIIYDDEFLNKKILNKNIFRNIKIKTNSINVIKEYLKEKDVIALVPKIAIEKELKSGELIEIYNREYEIEYDFYISYKKNIDAEFKQRIKKLIEHLDSKLIKI